jgi:hypothetical protein
MNVRIYDSIMENQRIVQYVGKIQLLNMHLEVVECQITNHVVLPAIEVQNMYAFLFLILKSQRIAALSFIEEYQFHLITGTRLNLDRWLFSLSDKLKEKKCNTLYFSNHL